RQRDRYRPNSSLERVKIGRRWWVKFGSRLTATCGCAPSPDRSPCNSAHVPIQFIQCTTSQVLPTRFRSDIPCPEDCSKKSQCWSTCEIHHKFDFLGDRTNKPTR